MSSSAAKPELPLLPVAPLDGESGYLRWKESVLLRLHTLGLAHVLSEEEEPERPAVVKQQRARDDALCRGHILATLSDRLLPVYAHHATAGAVWRAVGLTYDLDAGTFLSRCKTSAFRYDEGKPLLEQLALLQALATLGKSLICLEQDLALRGFPSEVVRKVHKRGPGVPMDEIWEIARKHEELGRLREIDQHAHHTSDDSRPLKRERQGR
ncbi:uncharacterized protein LOC124697600 [Lolium rigidum]|uniref:uncharacterized protein LOC124697600 n=1 Tax=Lolium rigidum TaxID=89674 RepID=UPI001F5C189A|nr:uncharacterized protein LOC124697600 [Lolium rigidum]